MTKHTILFLAANPVGAGRLALDEEARAIHEELERSGHRDKFELVTRWAVRPLDLLRELRKLKPAIVHFSGHGGCELQASTGLRREVLGKSGAVDGTALDPDQQYGLCFQGPDGRPQLVSAAGLAQAFGAAGSSVKLVVLNACYSNEQAEALLVHVGCVVGMRGAIHDDAARSFAIGFYGGLGEHESIATAFEQGEVAINLEGLPDADRPRLRVRAGVDARALILANVAPEPAHSRPETQLSRTKRRVLASAGIAGLIVGAAIVVRFALRGDAPILVSGHYVCQSVERTFSRCLVADRADGKRQLSFDGPTHEPGALVDQYSGELQCSAPPSCSAVLTNRFDPQPTTGGDHAQLQQSRLDLSLGADKRWAGTWTFQNGERRDFLMIWKGAP